MTIFPGFDPEAHRRRIEDDGFTVIPDFLDAATLAEVRRVLALLPRHAQSAGTTSRARAPSASTRWSARGRVFWPIVLDPRVLALCEHYLEPGLPAHREPGDRDPPRRDAAAVPLRRHVLPPAAAPADGVAVDDRRGRRVHGRERRHRGDSRQPSLGDERELGGALRRARPRPTPRARRRRGDALGAAGGAVDDAGRRLRRVRRHAAASRRRAIAATGRAARSRTSTASRGRASRRTSSSAFRPGGARDAGAPAASCSATRSTRRSWASSPRAIRARRWRRTTRTRSSRRRAPPARVCRSDGGSSVEQGAD